MIEPVRRYVIYGLRLRGSKEVQYIGRTCKTIEARLDGHLSQARSSSRFNSAFSAWLVENASKIEAFKIGYVDTLEEARAMEAAIIALCCRLEHRLLNHRLLPEHLITQRREALKAARKRSA